MDPLFVLVGPTAGGKSRAAVPVARELGAEIVSLDSMLLYKGMNIGTDKPATGGVPHHLIDLLDPQERFDLRRYIEEADRAIADITARGRRVLVVGGTGLYLQGLLKGVFEGVARDAELRARLADTEPAVLHARLREVDPEAADRIHENDRRRIVRALEVHAATGRPLSALQTQFEGPDRYPAILAGLAWPRRALKQRVKTRVEAMFRAGLVDEVSGLALGPTAAQAVGYKEVSGALRGDYDLEEARRLIERNTMRLARRQATWFKRFPIRWVDGAAADVVARLLAVYRGSTSE
ncbi:MAG: tRNA (adenosine(37)-N6)-dimethylallyltransferase MiaA [Planctomycetota bacterium]|jgi:tRNA dimethylallyltransferase